MTTPGTSLSVERYAEVLAFVVHYRAEPLDHTLRAVGLTLDDWTAAEAHWTSELSLYEKRGQGLLSMKFAAAYGKMRRRLARYGMDAMDASAKAADVVGPFQRSPALGPDPAAAAAPRAPVEPAAPAPAMPSYALAQQQMQAQHVAQQMQQMQPMQQVQQVQQVQQMQQMQQMQQVHAQPPQPPAWTPPPAQHAPPNLPKPGAPGTFFLPDGGNPASRPLPFQAGAPNAPPPDAPAHTGPALAKGGTAFAPDGAPPAASTLLPFEHTPAAQAGELPPLPQLSLEHYVALQVELSSKPDQMESILARYKIQGADQKHAIDQAFRAHLRANGALRQRYEMLVQRFSAFAR